RPPGGRAPSRGGRPARAARRRAPAAGQAVSRGERGGARRARAPRRRSGQHPARAGGAPRRGHGGRHRPRGDQVNVTTIPAIAIDRYLKLVRIPLDTAIGFLPGNGDGRGPAAELALDRADATLRAIAASVLANPDL